MQQLDDCAIVPASYLHSPSTMQAATTIPHADEHTHTFLQQSIQSPTNLHSWTSSKNVPERASHEIACRDCSQSLKRERFVTANSAAPVSRRRRLPMARELCQSTFR